MSEKSDFSGDSRVDGAVHDGYRYLVKFKDGTKEFARDHDDFASVNARWNEALVKVRVLDTTLITSITSITPSQLDGIKLFFSGARAVEEEDDDGRPVAIGEVRGKGAFFAAEIRGIAYTRLDGDEAPELAFQAAAALLESQNLAQAQALAAIQEVQRKMLEGAGAEQSQPQSVEDVAANAL